jgi:hypothetical protein
MAGATLTSELSASEVAFELATPEDDQGIRRLLREQPMAGRISLSLEREPDYFREPRDEQTLVARLSGRLVGLGSCTFSERFVNGTPRRVGYLGALRLGEAVAGRFDVLRRGYRFLHQLQWANPAAFYFTSIAADNQRARRFLERGLPGMPRYQFLTEFVTLAISVPQGRHPQLGPAYERPLAPHDLVSVANAHNSAYQLAPYWSIDKLTELAPLGLSAGGFRCVRNDSTIAAAAALWDQSNFKQAIVRGYGAPLNWARPIVNLAARVARAPRLPPIGCIVRQAVVSPFVASNPEQVRSLFAQIIPLARQQNLQFITVGFAASDPRLQMIRQRFSCVEYRSRIYSVTWPDIPTVQLNNNNLFPDVAWL